MAIWYTNPYRKHDSTELLQSHFHSCITTLPIACPPVRRLKAAEEFSNAKTWSMALLSGSWMPLRQSINSSSSPLVPTWMPLMYRQDLWQEKKVLLTLSGSF